MKARIARMRNGDRPAERRRFVLPLQYRTHEPLHIVRRKPTTWKRLSKKLFRGQPNVPRPDTDDDVSGLDQFTELHALSLPSLFTLHSSLFDVFIVETIPIARRNAADLSNVSWNSRAGSES